MGFNTSVIVLNDHLHEIRKDADFGKKLADAIGALSLPPELRSRRGGGAWGVDVSSGGCSSAATAIETHHADYDSIVAFGGNSGRIISEAVYPSRAKEDESMEVRYLRALADSLGYNIRKKPTRK